MTVESVGNTEARLLTVPHWFLTQFLYFMDIIILHMVRE